MKNILFAGILLSSMASQAMTVECVVSSKEHGSSIQKMVTENSNFMADLTSVDEAYYTVVTQAQKDENILIRIVRDIDGVKASEESLTKKVVFDDEEFGIKITCAIKK